jgi:hypothetical protein
MSSSVLGRGSGPSQRGDVYAEGLGDFPVADFPLAEGPFPTLRAGADPHTGKPWLEQWYLTAALDANPP